MRKSGALSLTLITGLMTVLAFRESVVIVPVKLSPSRVKVPMVAMLVSFGSPKPPNAASHAHRPEPPGGAGSPQGNGNFEAQRSRGMAEGQGKILVEPEARGSRLRP